MRKLLETAEDVVSDSSSMILSMWVRIWEGRNNGGGERKKENQSTYRDLNDPEG